MIHVGFGLAFQTVNCHTAAGFTRTTPVDLSLTISIAPLFRSDCAP